MGRTPASAAMIPAQMVIGRDRSRRDLDDQVDADSDLTQRRESNAAQRRRVLH